MSELHEAAAAGDSGALRLALDQEGCKVDAEDPACGNRTALHLAAGGGHTDCVRLLIRAGADVAKQSRGGWTAAHCGEKQQNKPLLYWFGSSLSPFLFNPTPPPSCRNGKAAGVALADG
eukprot:m.186883 g.186883  ORF g.186883 m.186883 type:complete len:119 (-) comp18147_c0_seq4:222-578(-)